MVSFFVGDCFGQMIDFRRDTGVKEKKIEKRAYSSCDQIYVIGKNTIKSSKALSLRTFGSRTCFNKYYLYASLSSKSKGESVSIMGLFNNILEIAYYFMCVHIADVFIKLEMSMLDNKLPRPLIF